jgi:hypothetical protein
VDRDLVVCSHQIDFRKDGTAEMLVGVVVKVADGIAVGNGAGIEGSIITAGAPAIVFFGTMWRAEDQELPDRRAVPSRNMATNSALAIASRSGGSRRVRQVTGGPGTVRTWWTVL